MPAGKVRSNAGQNLPEQAQAASAAEIERALRTLQEALGASPRALNFRVDKGSGRTVITVVDADTNQVVRQIPSEEVLALSRALSASRALVDEHA